MLVTEKDAKTKWCPMVRAVIDGQDRCMGRSCMFWRWNPGQTRGFLPVDDASAPRPKNVPKSWELYVSYDDRPDGWHEPDAEFTARRLGFCGNAVRPFED